MERKKQEDKEGERQKRRVCNGKKMQKEGVEEDRRKNGRKG